ncbi:MAG: site-specific DNA-methyltransferase [Caldilineaceae bacterium]|nr:site-specific DNA-methyltransferase [Caldilineaceae bacterium]
MNTTKTRVGNGQLVEGTRTVSPDLPAFKAEQVVQCDQRREKRTLTIREHKVTNDNELDSLLTPDLRAIPLDGYQRAIPALAKRPGFTSELRGLIRHFETDHQVILGDAREVQLPPSSVHLIVTSPPYWTLKEYPECEGQMGQIGEYSAFLASLNGVWESCYEALVPGGRMVCVVGDVCLSRRQNGGRHMVMPLHASIQTQCCEVGFDNLAPIIWHKISNLRTEANRSVSYLGKPFEPNGVIKNDIEFVLMLRKPGGYRSPSAAARLLSVISADEHKRWFRQIWDDIRGASTRDHPAPFPVELAERLIRMFSFVGDTVFDPFTGSASTQVAAQRSGRHSIGIEIEPTYHAKATERLAK